MELSDGLDADAGGVARQIGKRHILDVDDLDAGTQRAGGDRRLGGFRLGVSERLVAADLGQRIDAVDLSGDLAMAAPTALATAKWLGLITSSPPIGPSTRMEPPPTTITGNGSGDSRERSTQSSSIAVIRACTRAMNSGVMWATFDLSPKSARPAATIRSEVVSVLPPKISPSVTMR